MLLARFGFYADGLFLFMKDKTHSSVTTVKFYTKNKLAGMNYGSLIESYLFILSRLGKIGVLSLLKPFYRNRHANRT